MSGPEVPCVFCASLSPPAYPAPHGYRQEREAASSFMLEYCEAYGAPRVLGALCGRHRRMHEETRSLCDGAPSGAPS